MVINLRTWVLSNSTWTFFATWINAETSFIPKNNMHEDDEKLLIIFFLDKNKSAQGCR